MIEIRETPLGGKLNDFLDVVDYIYKGDRAFIRPLDQDLKDRLNPKKNPFFEHGEGVAFTAHKNGRCVGRITAQIDREHLKVHKDDAGFWGFLDTTEDEEVARALLEKAEAWLRAKGMKRARGPMSLSVNEEVGCLVEGFEHPPFVLMPHHRAYQAGLIEKCGYTKEKDVWAWRYEVGEMNARTRKAHEEIANMPEVVSREIDMGNLRDEVMLALAIFNDAWSGNWGFVPITDGEGRKMAQDFKLFVPEELTRLVFIDGEPAAVAMALPNINELITDLGGKLFPFGLPKLLYRMKVVGAKTGRLFILGIKRKYRGVKKYAGLSAFLYAEMNDAGKRLGMTWGELGWTLEDNAPINVAIKALGAKKYKTYRLFGKSLEA
jgi:hypothetical protein